MLYNFNIAEKFIAEKWLLFSIAFFVFTLATPPLFMDQDVSWHVASGQYIVQHLTIPTYDPWSYVGLEQEWYNLSWLWDIFCFLISNFFGYQGLAIAPSIILSVLCVLSYESLKKREYGTSNDASMIAITLTSLIFIDIGYMRPQLLSCILAIIFVNTLYNFYYRNSQLKLLRLSLLTLLWANSHGAFILIFAFFGIFIFLSLYEKKSCSNIMVLLKALIFCSIITLINPLGVKIYIGVLRTLHSSVTPYISEWRPLTFGTFYSFSLILSIILLAGCALRTHYCNAKINTSDWILGIVLFISSLASLRNFSIFAALGAPFTAAIIDRSLPHAKFQTKLPLKYQLFCTLTLLIISISLNTFFILSSNDRKLGMSKIPSNVFTYLAAHHPNITIMNNYNIGGYAIMFGNGKLKHFVDGRAGTVFTEETLREYLEILNDKNTLLKLAKKHQVDGVVISSSSLLKESKEDKEHWKDVFRSQDYVLLLNKESH